MTDEGASIHPNALPNYEKAVIPPAKLEKYALNLRHVSRAWGKSSGSDKARVFKSVLGFDQSNWELLRDQILEKLPYYEAILGEEDEYGKRYTVTLPITGANGNTVNVLTGWIILRETDYPSLTTAFCQ